MIKPLLSYLAFLFISAISFSQPQLEFKRISAQYPDEKMVVVKNQKTLHYQLEDGKLSVSSTDYEECIYLDSKAGIFSERNLRLGSLEKLEKINALSLVPKKNKYKKIKIEEFKTDSILGQDVFYDGSNKISFFYPSLGVGVKSVLEYSKNFMEPRLTGAYYFQEFVPVLESEFIVIVPDQVDIGWQLFNTHDSLVDFKIEKKNKQVTYTWKMKNLDKYPREESSPDLRYSIPHIVSWIKSYSHNNRQKSFLSSPTDLYSWYYEITKDVNTTICSELKGVVDSITRGNKSELDIVREVFYWVEDHIKYIAIEDGMGGFVPRSAKSVFEKRYGDCKDMASILSTMLQYAGIEKAYLTWIGSRDIPYIYAQVPTPVTDNHMIVTYIHGEDYYFLDATGRNIPFGMPTPFIQGKEALIGIDKDNFIIKEVPIIPPATNLYIDSINVSLENTHLTGKAKSFFTGYYDYSSSDYLLDNKDDLKKVLREYLGKGSNKFVLDTFATGDLTDRDHPLSIDYSFTIEDYARKNGDEIYVNLVLDETFTREDIKYERKNPIEKRFNAQYMNHIRFTIPPGYKVTYVPANSTFKEDKFGFSIHYSQNNDQVILDYSVTTNYLLLPKSDFELWNAMIKKLQKANSEMIILKKI